MNQTVWVYQKTEPRLYTVGYFDPDGKWHPDSDHCTREEAAYRAHFLNGGGAPAIRAALASMLEAYAPQADFSKPGQLHSAVLAAGKALGKL